MLTPLQLPKILHQYSPEKSAFTDPGVARRELPRKVRAHNRAAYHPLGHSEQGRLIYAVEMGRGTKNISLLAGSHSDEPVGPETLRTLLDTLLKQSDHTEIGPLLDTYTFHIIPHINPDGEAVNWSWIRNWPDLESYVEHAFREAPGRDLEFGYPNMRVENRLVSSYLRDQGPFDLHMSLHGMAFSEGCMLLIERNWIERTESLRTRFRRMTEEFNWPLHDHDRGGEKGFEYIGPGFSTTPEGRGMQAHFEQRGETETARKFHLSSMEFVRQLGGDPLCLVTELPLFLVAFSGEHRQASSPPGTPEAYLALKEKIPLLRKRRQEGSSFKDLLEPFEFHPMPLSTALQMQFRTLDYALEII